jgi:hypothetical protein
MRKIIRLLIFGGLFFSGCEEDPIIQTDGFQTKPVIYSIIETFDSVHYLKLGRFFSGCTDPAITAKIRDSIYFDQAIVKVTIFNSIGTGVNVPIERVLVTDKEQGFFNSGDYKIYRFKEKLVLGEYPYYYLPFADVSIEVDIPGLPLARCITALVLPPRIWSPFKAQEYVYIFSDSPLKIVWSGGYWNEIDVNFKVIEEYRDTTITRSFSLQKTNDININGQYYEIKVPYELVVETLEKNLKVRSDLYRRYFGFFRIDVLTGNADFSNYKKFINGINDFNFNPFNSIVNGIGVLAAKCTTIQDSLSLDLPSRLNFAAEPRLKKFRFIEY